jgi:hypothetical protein
MGDATPQAQPAAPGGPTQLHLPQWVYVLALLLGVPLAGGGGSLLGASQAQDDLQRVERKVDELDAKLDVLTLAIARAHPDVQVGP